MDKLGRERGLISYATLSDYAANMALTTSGGTAAIDPSRVRDAHGAFRDKVRHLSWRIVFRPRVLVYFGVWTMVGFGVLFGLLARDRLELNVLHDRNPQFVVESDGSVRNGYMVKLLNMIPEQRTISLTIEGMPTATMRVAGQATGDGRSVTIGVEPDKVTPLKVFVTLPKGGFAEAEGGFSLIAEDPSSHERDVYQANFNLPGAARR